VPWLASRCRQLGLTADADALALLAERTQGNLLAARQELDKLRLLLADGKVTAQAVLMSAADSARFDVSELREALTSGAASRAVRILGGLRAEGVEVPLVLWAVVRALRELSESVDAPGGPGRVSRWRTLSVRRLTERALRADAMAKGRIAGDAWDELTLLAVDAAGRAALPLAATVPN
jgi:DNA polymerase-3 subunit delta